MRDSLFQGQLASSSYMSAPYLALEIKCNINDFSKKTLVNVDCYENIRGGGHFWDDCDLLQADLCTWEHWEQML